MTKFVEVKYAQPYPAAKYGFLLRTKLFYPKDGEVFSKVYQKAERFAERQEKLTGYTACLVCYSMTGAGLYAPKCR